MAVVLEQFFRPPYTIMYPFGQSRRSLRPLTPIGTHSTSYQQKRDRWDLVSVANMLCVDTPVAKNVVSVSPPSSHAYAVTHAVSSDSVQIV